jgi:type I restriction enzyme S subunit
MKFGLDENIIEELIKIFEKNSKVDKAFVFGSRAKGNYRPDSDIDIAIKGNEITIDDILKMSVAFDDKGIKYKIDLIDYNTIKEPALKEHIDRVGIEFYSKWKKVMLQDVVSKLGDGLHGTPAYDNKGEYYFINGNNLIDGKIVIKESTQRVTETEYLKYKKELNDRTILLGINGTIGNVALYNNEKCVLGKSACYFNVIDSVNKDYIKYVITGNDFQSYIENFANGSTIKNVSLKVIREFEFPLPPFKEQASIASTLKSLDDKIDLLNRQNKTLEQMAETVFRQWFVEEEVEGNTVKLGDVVKTSSGGTPSRSKMEYYFNGTIKWVKSKELQGSFIFDTEEKITDDAVKNSSAKLFPANTILIAMYGATVGEYAILAEPATCNQAICGLIPNDNYPYTFLFILTKYNKEHLIGLAGGSAQQNISQELIKDLEISNSIEKIKEYHKIVNAYFQKIKSNQTQIRTLTQTRDTLLPKLMSGEVQVAMN